MKLAVKVLLWVAGIVFGLFVLVFILGITPWMLTGLVHLVVGWLTHAVTVLPQVTVKWSGVGMLALCLVLAGGIGHRFCVWLWKGGGHQEPWRPRWTAAGLAAIVLMFAAGMAFTAVAHQTGWMLRSQESLISSGQNTRNASTSLKTLASAQADFRSNDRDDNKVNDFWRGDIAGLYALQGSGGYPIKLIELSVAAADYDPKTELKAYAERHPKAGYWFKALRFRDEKTPDPQRWAAIAFPDSLSAGKWMFIISDENTIYRKLAETPIPDLYPDDPVKEGWSKLD